MIMIHDLIYAQQKAIWLAQTAVSESLQRASLDQFKATLMMQRQNKEAAFLADQHARIVREAAV